MEGPSDLPDVTSSWTHNGTVILRLKTGNYSIIIKPSITGSEVIEWDGIIPAATLNELSDNSRMKVEIVYSGPNTEIGTFLLDKISIKENYTN